MALHLDKQLVVHCCVSQERHISEINREKISGWQKINKEFNYVTSIHQRSTISSLLMGYFAFVFRCSSVIWKVSWTKEKIIRRNEKFDNLVISTIFSPVSNIARCSRRAELLDAIHLFKPPLQADPSEYTCPRPALNFFWLPRHWIFAIRFARFAVLKNCVTSRTVFGYEQYFQLWVLTVWNLTFNLLGFGVRIQFMLAWWRGLV